MRSDSATANSCLKKDTGDFLSAGSVTSVAPGLGPRVERRPCGLRNPPRRGGDEAPPPRPQRCSLGALTAPAGAAAIAALIAASVARHDGPAFRAQGRIRHTLGKRQLLLRIGFRRDRKSTRLNSS